MPHAPHLRKWFGHHWRTVTRPRIIARAIQEFGRIDWLPLTEDYAPCEWCHEWALKSRIQVAHLVIPPGEPGHDDDSNLVALCRSCHDQYDFQTRAEAAWLTRTARKDPARPLLQEAL
jgi:hypothetical protein